jgi:uncharacterized protein RhaS with RHS repeats
VVVPLVTRAYGPTLGRSLSVDPVIGGCANDYVYVKGDPINNSDPNGTQSCRNFAVATSNGGMKGTVFLHDRRVVLSFVWWPAAIDAHPPDPAIEYRYIGTILNIAGSHGPYDETSNRQPYMRQDVVLPGGYYGASFGPGPSTYGTLQISLEYIGVSTFDGNIATRRTINTECTL